MRQVFILTLMFVLQGTALAEPVPGQGTWETVLQPRDLDGDPTTIEGYYDTLQDITWYVDWNVADALNYGTLGDGRVTTQQARGMVNSLNNQFFLGSNQWRLPKHFDLGEPGCQWNGDLIDCAYSPDLAAGEMVDVFYAYFGGTPRFDVNGGTQLIPYGVGECEAVNVNTGPFKNLMPGNYTTKTRNSSSAFYAFHFCVGELWVTFSSDRGYAALLHPGDYGSADVDIPVVEKDVATGRVARILNITSNGKRYNVHFDKGAGANIFDGDMVAAEALVNDVNAYLNEWNYIALDNGHPGGLAAFAILSDAVSVGGYTGCNSGLIPGCNAGDWADVGYGSGLGPLSVAFVERIPYLVSMDIKPNDESNFIDTEGSPSSKINVAVITSAIADGDEIDFDATTIISSTVQFGPGGAATVRNEPGTENDVDADGDLDLLLKFQTGASGIACGHTDPVQLSGELENGDLVYAEDFVTTPECPSCHP
jgi:hypothetical protein